MSPKYPRVAFVNSAPFFPLLACTGCGESSLGSSGSDNPSASRQLMDAGIQEIEKILNAPNPEAASASLITAYDLLSSSLDEWPDNHAAKFIFSFVELPYLFDNNREGSQSDLASLLSRFGLGIINRSIFGFDPSFPEELPNDSPLGGEVQDWIFDHLLSEVQQAAERLESVPSTFSEVITWNSNGTVFDILRTSL